MRAVIQRVLRANVKVGEEISGQIENGILLLLGISKQDNEAVAVSMLEKIVNLRIFDDQDGKMNLSLKETGGGLLVVSQFTLYGDARKGRRPSYIEAAPPEKAASLYGYFVELARKNISRVETGVFQAMMKVELVNDGPVTILIDSDKQF